jgi:hypothetical protein
MNTAYAPYASREEARRDLEARHLQCADLLSFSSGRLRDLDIASNAAGDIVEIRSALVEIR